MSNEVTKQLYARQNGRCFYCKQQMLEFNISSMSLHERNIRQNLPLYPTYEHAIVLKKDGGKRTVENGVCSCFTCNQLKGIIAHKAFARIVTNATDQQILATHVTGSEVSITLNFMSTTIKWMITKIKKFEHDLNQLAVESSKVINVSDLIFLDRYPHLNNKSHIMAGLANQQNKCGCCSGDLVVPYTIPPDEYFTSKLRPIAVKKVPNNSTAVVCFRCSSSITPKKLYPKIVAF
ncbi:MAG: hypothetical protein KAS32_14915 [Candidatus Peribacteraceae bacterium]|nr:hypothetical protein [Candidatus Peribacteraceae bacterium]